MPDRNHITAFSTGTSLPRQLLISAGIGIGFALLMVLAFGMELALLDNAFNAACAGMPFFFASLLVFPMIAGGLSGYVVGRAVGASWSLPKAVVATPVSYGMLAVFLMRESLGDWGAPCFIVAIVGSSFLMTLLGVYRGGRVWKVNRVGVCRACGYALTGNVSGRCPECGTKIPPT